ncbi:hypothetical protein G6F65_015612 [Rhizopus arrhizus]|nr:hypothetical protein G6F65_015612 [Rhizopus arrhizus]
MLEKAAHQHALVPGEDVFGAIAVVDVEVHDGHARQAVEVQRMTRRNGHVVQEAESHRLRSAGMVTGRTHRAEGRAGLAAHHRIHGRHPCAGRMQGGLVGVGSHPRVGIYRCARAAGHGAMLQAPAGHPDKASIRLPTIGRKWHPASAGFRDANCPFHASGMPGE